MSKKLRKWSVETTIQFLQLYEQHPCLWDHTIVSYKDKKKRVAALENMVEVMSSLIDDFDFMTAKAKIRSIRNAYILERHKVRKSMKEAEASNNIYKPTVRWFSAADKFLKHIIETKDANANDHFDNKKKQGKTMKRNIEMSDSEDIHVKQEILISSMDEEQEVVKSRNESNGIYESPEQQLYTTAGIRDRDECSVFGEQVAFKLRKLDEYTRQQIQYKIYCILHDAEMKVLSKYKHYT